MKSSRPLTRPRGDVAVQVGGAVVSLVVAATLWSRLGITGQLSRDESIYAYSGQQLAHGVPPYASIFDPKSPLASMVAGLGALVARLVGRNDVYLIRLAFFACACLTAVALYLLALRLFESVLAGVTAVVVFAVGQPFALDALSGPDAKTPGVLFGVLAMLLMARRRWAWAGAAGALAALTWQPLIVYPLVAVVLAYATERGTRWRAVAWTVVGGAVPVVVMTLYFSLTGALHAFLESALVFPLSGVTRRPETVGHRLVRIVAVVDRYYGMAGVLFWAGLAALVVLAVVHLVRGRHDLRRALLAPLVSVVLVTLLGDIAYAATDFQSYPDLFPALVYPGLGLAGVVAAGVALLRRHAARLVAGAAVAVALTVLAGVSWVQLGAAARIDPGLRPGLADACAVERLLVPGTPLLALGDPTPLVLTHRRNPDRFIYLGSGVDRWKVRHTPGGFAAWTAQVAAARPSVVVVSGWAGPFRMPMVAWLRGHGYTPSYVGGWRVFLIPAARERARTTHVKLTGRATEFATGPGGRQLPAHACG